MMISILFSTLSLIFEVNLSYFYFFSLSSCTKMLSIFTLLADYFVCLSFLIFLELSPYHIFLLLHLLFDNLIYILAYNSLEFFPMVLNINILYLFIILFLTTIMLYFVIVIHLLRFLFYWFFINILCKFYLRLGIKPTSLCTPIGYKTQFMYFFR